MNVQEFQNKLKEIQTIAKANGNSLTAIQIRDTFAGMELDKTQLLGVLKYLTSQGIQIEGMEDSATEETKEPERKKIPLTPEEETYLRNYLEELPELPRRSRSVPGYPGMSRFLSEPFLRFCGSCSLV